MRNRNSAGEIRKRQRVPTPRSIIGDINAIGPFADFFSACMRITRMQPCAPWLIDKHSRSTNSRVITASALCRKSTAIRRLINTVFDMRAAPARQSENHRCRATPSWKSLAICEPLSLSPLCPPPSSVSRMLMDIFFPTMMNIKRTLSALY